MEEAVILYDDDCSFCRWLLAKILAWDRRARLRPVALQDPEADVLLREMPDGRKMDSWHLVIGSRIYSAGAAIAPLAKLLPLGGPVAMFAEYLPGVAEWLYRLVADNRDRLGARIGPGACVIERRPRA